MHTAQVVFRMNLLWTQWPKSLYLFSRPNLFSTSLLTFRNPDIHLSRFSLSHQSPHFLLPWPSWSPPHTSFTRYSFPSVGVAGEPISCSLHASKLQALPTHILKFCMVPFSFSLKSTNFIVNQELCTTACWGKHTSVPERLLGSLAVSLSSSWKG